SRNDTDWTVVSSATNSYHLNRLVSGNYEWQIIPVCSGITVDTARSTFSNSNLSACGQPTSLTSDNITTSAVTLYWIAPYSLSVTKYVVQYSRVDSVNWVSDTVTGSSKNESGLLPGKTYQWRVQTVCPSGYSDFSSSTFNTDAVVAACNLPSGLSTSAL